MRLHDHSLSRVSLADVLRRRRSSLKKFLADTGIVTYELLLARCKSMGVLPPEETDFLKARGIGANEPVEAKYDISSPAEGVVVLDPPNVIDDDTGKPVELLEAEAPGVEVSVMTQPSYGSKHKKKR